MSKDKNEHSCMISGIWLHKPAPLEHRRRALRIWEKLFTSYDMGGRSAKGCGVIVLTDGKISYTVFESSLRDALMEKPLTDLLEMFVSSESAPSALLAGTCVADLPGSEIGCLAIEEGLGLIRDAHIKSEGKDTKNKKPSVAQPSAQSLLSAASKAGLQSAETSGLVLWKGLTSEIKECATSVMLNPDGELFVCADAPNDVYLAVSPELSETVFISSLWEQLRDDACVEIVHHMGGFFKETISKENLVGVVLSKGQVAVGIPGEDGNSGHIDWTNK